MIQKILFPLLLLMFITACKNDDTEILFELKYPNQVFEIPAGINPFESHHFVMYNLPTNFLSTLDAHNMEESDIRELVPGYCRLSNISGNASYDFIQEISVKIFSTSKPEKKFEIFYDDAVPYNTGSTLYLIPNANDVLEFLSEETFSIDVVLVRLRDAPREFINTRIEFGFNAL